MECALALLKSGEELLLESVHVGIVGKLQVVDARHDAGEVVVRRVVAFAGLAHYGEHGRQAPEACGEVSSVISMDDSWHRPTSNGKLGTAGGELQEVASLDRSQLAHRLQKILDAAAVHVETMIRLDRVHECCFPLTRCPY